MTLRDICPVSIPRGAVKSEKRAAQTQIEVVSIPRGAVKRRKLFSKSTASLEVSIPRGAVKSTEILRGQLSDDGFNSKRCS